MKAEERKRKREEKARLDKEEEMRKLEELTRPDKSSSRKNPIKKKFNYLDDSFL